MAANPAVPDDDDDTGADASQDASGASDTGGDDDSQPEVIATILCYPDGSYGLVKGDEDDEGAGGGESESASGGEAGGAEQPERFTEIGPLLKSVMETVKEYESTKGGAGSESANFDAGYGGASATAAPTPTAGAM